MIDMEAEWDRMLSEREIEMLSPVQKGQRSRRALQRKVEMLEEWAREPIQANIHRNEIPWSRPKLRNWFDEARRLWPWKFADVDHPEGKNKELIERYQKALADIKLLFGVRSDEAEMEALRIRILRLEEQNLQLLDAIQRLQRFISPKAPAR